LTSYWKIGAISGLIAGIVAGISFTFIEYVGLTVGLPYWNIEVPLANPLMTIVLPNIIIYGIFGVFLGIIFSKIYDLIPGKTGLLKGFVLGLGFYLILSFRNMLFTYAYGYYAVAITCLISIETIIYGLILGILYKAPAPKLETKKYDMKDGIIPGAITGAIFSIMFVIFMVTSAYLGFIYKFMETYPAYVTDIGFIISQYGAHTVINMFMMGCYGVFYVRFYDRIPGKAIIKGAIFGFIIWIFTDLFNSVYSLTYGDLPGALWAGLTVPDMYIAVGILIEGFYKKRWQAFAVAIAILIFSILKNFIITTLLGPH
jgi:hypothetical protein